MGGTHIAGVHDGIGKAIEHGPDLCEDIGAGHHEAEFSGLGLLWGAGHWGVDEVCTLAFSSAAILMVEAGSAVEQSAMMRPSRKALLNPFAPINRLFNLWRSGDA